MNYYRIADKIKELECVMMEETGFDQPLLKIGMSREMYCLYFHAVLSSEEENRWIPQYSSVSRGIHPLHVQGVEIKPTERF